MAANDTAQAAKDAIEKQIAELRDEFEVWKKRARSRAEDVGEDVADWADDAADQARSTGRALKARAQDAAEVVSGNPTIFSGAAAIAAVVGVAAGILIGQAIERQRRWF